MMLWHRPCGVPRPSLADYVRGPGPRGAADAAEGY